MAGWKLAAEHLLLLLFRMRQVTCRLGGLEVHVCYSTDGHIEGVLAASGRQAVGISVQVRWHASLV